MRSVLAIVIMVAAIFALVAGSFAMVNMGSGSHTNCLAAIPGSPKCLGRMDLFQFAITHISTLLGISLGIVSPITAFLLAAFAVLVWIAVSNSFNLLLGSLGYSRVFIEAEIGSARKQHHWISLLEKRDPSSSCAMNV